MGTKAKIIIFSLIFLNIVLASWWVIDGNIFFHTDIARDFLLMEDIVDNKNLTLIGPRSGAIPGLFHGPLWLYFNLPAFIIGGGNPAVTGWFWVGLYILSLVIVYVVGKKIFSEEVGLLSTLLLSTVTILNVRTLFNPYGALIISPLYFYFFIEYLKRYRVYCLIIAFFILGLIIQFQMAFGVPFLILSILYLIYHLLKNKKILHILSSLIMIIPLSTFLLFDLRNNFLQVKSVINYIFGSESHGKMDINFLQLTVLRAKESITEGLGSLTTGNIYLSIALLLFLISALYINFKKKKVLIQFFIIYYFLGFWFFTLFFKGPVWNYYFLPFLPLIVLLFVSLKNSINTKLFYIVFILIYIVNLHTAINDVKLYDRKVEEQDVSTWKFNKLVAQKVFESEEKEFGYFIFTPDLYGYSPRYAMNYFQKKYQDKKVYPFVKKQTTYLIIAPPPEYGKDPNSIWYKKNTNSKLWKENDIRITKNPFSSISFENNFLIEKYFLTDEEIKVEPNPYLIKDIFFR